MLTQVQTMMRPHPPGDAASGFLASAGSDARPGTPAEYADVARLLVASIAHELKQPLSAIATNAGASLRMLSADLPDVEGAKEAAQRTIRDVNRAAQIIDRLRAHFATTTAPSEAVNLNRVVVDVLALSRSELEARNVAARCNLAYNLPMLSGDRVQLEQVLLNLVRNASEAMSGVHDRAREITITTRWHEDGDVRLSVRDSGVGFRQEAAARLFRPFYTTKPDGTGIGLAISRSLVERHQGRLWAAPNQDGPGATLWLSIPCASRPSTRKASLPRRPTPERRTIVVHKPTVKTSPRALKGSRPPACAGNDVPRIEARPA